MPRKGTDEYDTEFAFLKRTKALLDREPARRARDVARSLPDLSSEVRARVRAPILEWSTPVAPEIVMEFRGLKVEEAIIDDLMRAIEQRPLVEALERRIRALQRREMELVREEAGGRYLGDHVFWEDEDALVVLSRLFTNWARWARAEPLEGP